MTTIVNSFADGTPGTQISTSGASKAGGLGTTAGVLFDAVSATGGSSSITYDTTHALTGTQSCLINSTAGGHPAYGQFNTNGSLVAATQHWFRLFLYFSASAVTFPVYAANNAGTRCADIVHVQVSGSPVLRFRNAAGGTILTLVNACPVGAWFRIEGYVISDASAGAVQLSLYQNPYDTVALETQTVTGQATNGGNITQARYGDPSGVNGLNYWMANVADSNTGPIGPGAVPLVMISGSPAVSGFGVASKPIGGTSVRLKVATNSALTQNVSYVAAQTPGTYGYMQHAAAGLAAGTQYYYQLADTPPGGTEALIGSVGQIKTLPPAGSPQSFRLAIASCIVDAYSTVPNPDAGISDWISWNADLNIFTGDFSYQDPGATTIPPQLAIYENQLINFGGAQNQMMSQAWGFYVRSDHDSTNVDNGDSDNAWTAANIQAVLTMFPFGQIADTRNPTVGLYKSFVVGRVRFILIDIRNTDRSPGANTDNSSKTMLGATQLAWLQGQLTQPEPLKVIVADTQWPGPFFSGQIDKWWSYSTERSAIISFIQANAATVQNLLLIHGDLHGVACMTGTANASWGGFPVYCAAPLRQTGGFSVGSTVFTQFYNNSGGDQRNYGRVTFTDSGQHITVNFQGWDAVNQVAQVAQTDVFTATGSGALLTCFP